MINIKDYFKSSSELILKFHTHGKEITVICNEILKCKKNIIKDHTFSNRNLKI